MFGLNFSYIFSLLALAFLGAAFFSVDSYLPKIRVWKSEQLFNQSKIYLDETIDNAGGLLNDGVRKGRIAHLLNPADQEVLLNYVRLHFRTDPSQALLAWSSALRNDNSLILRTELLDKSLNTLKDDTLSLSERKIAGEVCYREINLLLKNALWSKKPENVILVCELLAETGKTEQALEKLHSLLSEYPSYPEGIFMLTRLSIHLRDTSQLVEIGRELAGLSAQRNKIGIEAIRHMTLLHLLKPLSASSLIRCIELLRINPEAQAIDFMRIHALQYASSRDLDFREKVVTECATLFDLEKRSDLLVFSRWLGRLGAFSRLLDYLPASKARIEQDLFKLRMNALVQVGDIERIHSEIANAPMIPTLWRMAVESRAYAIQGNYKASIDALDRLLPLLGDDPREVRNLCSYLEATSDLGALTHVLENLVDQPIHAKFSLIKLLELRAGSASIDDLQNWLEKLSTINHGDLSLKISTLYVKLLNPSLASPSSELKKIIDQAEELAETTSIKQARITHSLGHLRNNDPTKAIVALGPVEDWRSWTKERAAWTFIASEVYRQNKDVEKAMILSGSIDFSNMDRAEAESLQSLFPESL